MASPHLRRQIPVPVGTTTTSQALPSQTTPPPAVSTTTTPNGSLPSSSTASGVSSLRNPVSSTTTSVARPTSSIPPSSTTSSSSASQPSPSDTPPFPTSQPGVPATVTETTSTAVPPPSGVTGPKPKSFLENRPLSGFVFGLSGLVFLILVFILITSFVRRRNRKRLLADASNFSFDPRDVEDGASDEKYSHSNLGGQHSTGHGHGDYPLENRVVVGASGIPRPVPAHSPPIPNYIPQDYGGYDGNHLTQYHNLGNVPVGYSPTPNPYDVYGPRNGGGYPNGPVQHDPYGPYSPNGDSLSGPDPGHSVPRQLQPGVRPAQGPTFAPHPPNNSPPPIPLTTQLPPPSYPQPSAADKSDIVRLPTPNFPPGTPGVRDSLDSVDDAYGGAFLGPDSPPVQRTLQVANV